MKNIPLMITLCVLLSHLSYAQTNKNIGLTKQFNAIHSCATKLYEPLILTLSAFQINNPTIQKQMTHMLEENQFFKPYATYKLLNSVDNKNNIFFVYLNKANFTYYALRQDEAYRLPVSMENIRTTYFNHLRLSSFLDWTIHLALELPDPGFAPAEHSIIWTIRNDHFPDFDIMEGIKDLSYAEDESDLDVLQANYTNNFVRVMPQIADKKDLDVIKEILFSNIHAISTVYRNVGEAARTEIATESKTALAHCQQYPLLHSAANSALSGMQ